jgi:hypothetical protein
MSFHDRQPHATAPPKYFPKMVPPQAHFWCCRLLDGSHLSGKPTRLLGPIFEHEPAGLLLPSGRLPLKFEQQGFCATRLWRERPRVAPIRLGGYATGIIGTDNPAWRGIGEMTTGPRSIRGTGKVHAISGHRAQPPSRMKDFICQSLHPALPTQTTWKFRRPYRFCRTYSGARKSRLPSTRCHLSGDQLKEAVNDGLAESVGKR